MCNHEWDVSEASAHACVSLNISFRDTQTIYTKWTNTNRNRNRMNVELLICIDILDESKINHGDLLWSCAAKNKKVN